MRICTEPMNYNKERDVREPLAKPIPNELDGHRAEIHRSTEELPQRATTSYLAEKIDTNSKLVKG